MPPKPGQKNPPLDETSRPRLKTYPRHRKAAILFAFFNLEENRLNAYPFLRVLK